MSRFGIRALVSGRVQGVYFRASTQAHARSLGLSGFVRNLADGRVEAVFVGTHEAVEDALDFIRKGPPNARVDAVEVEEVSEDSFPTPEGGFRIR